jgi:serine/threonine protein kinase
MLGVGHLHLKGFVHRDLKPENILIDADRHLRITDLRLVKPELTDAKATTNTFCGTPQCVNPRGCSPSPTRRPSTGGA